MTSGLWFTTDCNSPLSPTYSVFSQGTNIPYNGNGAKIVYNAEQNSLEWGLS